MAEERPRPETNAPGLVSALDWMRRNAVAPVIQAVQDNPMYAAAVNTRDVLQDVSNSPGAAPLHAFVRQGADELAQLLPAFPDSVKPTPEAGQLFEPTQAMVTEQLTGRQLDFDLDR